MIAFSLAVPRALSATCLNLQGSKRSSRSSPLPRTDGRYTQSTVADVCKPLICRESSSHHVFACNFFQLQARIQLPLVAAGTQRPPAAARIQVLLPGLPAYRLRQYVQLAKHASRVHATSRYGSRPAARAVQRRYLKPSCKAQPPGKARRPAVYSKQSSQIRVRSSLSLDYQLSKRRRLTTSPPLS
jgi:hypothetical protein